MLYFIILRSLDNDVLETSKPRAVFYNILSSNFIVKNFIQRNYFAIYFLLINHMSYSVEIVSILS